MSMTPDDTTDLDLDASQSSPLVHCSWADGVIEMRGESYPENSFTLYNAILQWLHRYLEGSDRGLRMELELNYLNTSSVRAMIEVFDRLQSAADDGRDVQIGRAHV